MGSHDFLPHLKKNLILPFLMISFAVNSSSIPHICLIPENSFLLGTSPGVAGMAVSGYGGLPGNLVHVRILSAPLARSLCTLADPLDETEGPGGWDETVLPLALCLVYVLSPCTPPSP